MKVLILGGSPARPGGVEAFCSRAHHAMNLDARLQVDWLPVNTAYLRPVTSVRAWQSLRTFWRRRHEGWSVVWLQYVNLADLAFLVAARAMGFKVVVTPHLGANWKSTRIAVLRTLSRTVLGLSSKFAYLSETQLQELALPAGVPRCRIHTFLPRSVGTRQLVVERRAGRPSLKLIHAGRLSHEKGSFLFLEVCARLKQLDLAFTAEVIGVCDDQTRMALNERIVEYGIKENVTLFPAMEEEELMKRLAAADFLIHLSILDSFPLIVLEALAAGAYPICIDLPGARKMTQDYCGRVVSPNEAVQAAVDILCQGDLEVARGEADTARNKVLDDYDWGTCVRLLENCIEQD